MNVFAFIVEDNPTIRENLISTLEELTRIKVVGTADSEADAISWLSSTGADWSLAIVDIFLKRGTGLGVLAACSQRAKGRKIVVLSNYATSDVRERCTALGADRVFDKSNEIEQLIEYCGNLSAE
jgi:two-component system, OmpR family, response regulator